MNANEVVEYLRNLRDKIIETQENSTAQEKFLLASNVLKEIKDQIPGIITNQASSKQLERLIKLLELSFLEDSVQDLAAKTELCRDFLRIVVFKCDLETLSKDVFGSHVLQSLLQCCLFFSKHDPKLDEMLKYFANTIEEKCLFELLHHNSGSHTLRSLLKTMMNVVNADNIGSTKKLLNDEDISVLADFELKGWCVDKLVYWSELWRKDISGMIKSSQACATLCLLLRLFKLHRLLNEDNNMILLLKDLVTISKQHCTTCRISCFALENCIKYATHSDFNNIFNTFIIVNLQELAENHLTNYIIQTVLSHPFFLQTHLEQFIDRIDFKRLLNTNSVSVVWKTCEACVRLNSCEAKYFKKLTSTLEIDGNTNIWQSIISCTKWTSPEKAGDIPVIRAKAAGSSILLNLLKFSKNTIKPLIDGFKNFLKVLKPHIVNLACDKHFSRVLQLLVDPKYKLLKEKYIKKLYSCIRKNILDIALDTNGAFVISSMFNGSDAKLRIKLLKSLLPHYDVVAKRNKKLVSVIKLDKFKANQTDIVNKLTKTQTIRTLFKDIIN